MLRCSHVLCRVEDIGSTVSSFTDLGFSMEWGSVPGKAHNAFIWFAEGPFIEFFEFPSSLERLRWPVSAAFGRGMGDRLAKWAADGDGWRDVALETEDTDLTDTRARLKAGGLVVSRRFRNSRTRPDGRRVRYQLVAPSPAALPFVVSAYDPPQRPEAITHANGATGVTAVHFGLRPEHLPDYDRLVGPDPWLRPRVSAVTGVLEVELAGLATSLDPASTCGAALVPARPVQKQEPR
ncbi:VOC family protein [Amycolatopsis thailandensis]|uniref:VOC family protein n=1 Tax=Amycolatopsis thailandensis TaxID=589330 RepID=UPI003627205C